MKGGTLLVTRATNLFAFRKRRLENLGFQNVVVTGEEKDALNMVINELKPRLVLVNSFFYQAATPYMMGQLLKTFPKLNIAAVSLAEFPDNLAAWFIWHGVKSYINLWEGDEEFYRGVEMVRDGKAYIAPKVQKLIDDYPEWPDTNDTLTKRQMEILMLLCNGLGTNEIRDKLQCSRRTVEWHFKELFRTFHVHTREELIKTAFYLDVVTKKDLCFAENWKTEQLPEWATRKLKMERRVAIKSASMRIL